MNRNAVSNKAILVFLILVLFLAFASLGTQGCADAASSGGGNAIEGVWTGVTSGSSSASVTLTVRSSERALRYGNPRSCDLALEKPISPDGSTQQFGIVSSTGGRCDAFLMGKFSVRPDGDSGDLAYTVSDSSNRVVESGRLRRSDR